jgi:hypothetical protein
VILIAAGQGDTVFTLAALLVRAIIRLLHDVRRNVVPEPYPTEEAQRSESYADDMV